jgi:hypothetical protein
MEFFKVDGGETLSQESDADGAVAAERAPDAVDSLVPADGAMALGRQVEGVAEAGGGAITADEATQLSTTLSPIKWVPLSLACLLCVFTNGRVAYANILLPVDEGKGFDPWLPCEVKH